MGDFARQILMSHRTSGKQYTPHLQWHLTEKCNLRCSHCYQDSYCDDGLGFPAILEILDQFRCLVLHFRKLNNSNVKGHITLTGGEPLVKKSLPVLIEEITKQGDLFTFAILSNGSLIDQNIAHWLGKMKPHYVQVSMDGNQHIHDAMRGVGNFEKTRQAIILLKKSNIRVMVSFTANQTNYQTFPEVVEACRKVNADFVWSDRYIPDRNISHVGELVASDIAPMSTEEVHDFFKIMRVEAEKCASDKTTKTKIKMHRALQFQYSNTKAYHCVAGETLLTVMPNGDLYPCRRMPVKIGNVLQAPLATLYFNSPFLRKLRDKKQISQGCENCSSSADCQGGLKCLSYAFHGDAHIKDPNCRFINTNPVLVTQAE